MSVRVLGQLAADVGGSPADLGGRQQRAVLARLVVARESVVSTDRIVDDLWRGEPPARALASLQAYVSNLRRALEPGRAPRSPARLLVTVPPGYAFRADEPDATVDAWRFEHLVDRARGQAVATPAESRALLDDALRQWRGPAYAEFADESWATTEVARLEELRRCAAESQVAVTLRCAMPGEAVVLAEVLSREAPLREESWRLLVLALWAANRTAEALAALRRARDVFGTELGIDLGPGLSGLEGDILGQRTAALREVLGVGDTHAEPPRAVALPHPPHPPARGEAFVGRDAELARLAAVSTEVTSAGSRLVLVTGEAGIGKSSLLAHAAETLEARGWLVVCGRCPTDEGTPAAFPWAEMLRALTEHVPADPALSAFLRGQSDPATADAPAARFRLHRQIATWVCAVADRQPLAVLLDDLHHADAETLALLTHVVEHCANARILLVVAFRPTDTGEALRDTLTTIASRSPHRISLGGLGRSAVDQLVTALYEGPVEPATVTSIAERTGGNPFYVRETIRLLASEGDLVAVSEVPQGVRDVIRRRLARLPGETLAVLGIAAVVGLEFDVDVIVEAADLDEARTVDALEAGLIAGLLGEPAPGRIAFTHALVRDTIYTDLAQVRLIRIHARVAGALARLYPDDHSVLAHHYARAASAETASLAVDHSRRAAELAERAYAYEMAVELLQQAIACHERSPAGQGDRPAERVELLGRLVRAQVRAGAIVAARSTRDRAVAVAESTGREGLLVSAFTAWTEPTPWTARPYAVVDRDAVDGLRSLLRRTDLEPATRCRLLATLVTELSGEGDPRATAAAAEAVDLARGVGDPALLALTLYEQAREMRWDLDPDARARLAAEIEEIAAEHHLTAYRWRAHYIAATAAAARGDVAGLRQSIDRGLETARRFQMAEPMAIGLAAEAMLAHIGGQFDLAELRYAEVASRLARSGSPHAAGFDVLALVTVRASQGRLAEFAPVADALIDQFHAAAVDVAAAAFAAAGSYAKAGMLLTDASPLRPDFYFSIFATLRAGAVVASGQRDRAEELWALLLPLRTQLAGAASTSLAMRPVAHTLADLALLLGRRGTARELLAEAVEVADRWGAPGWLGDARRALAAVDEA